MSQVRKVLGSCAAEGGAPLFTQVSQNRDPLQTIQGVQIMSGVSLHVSVTSSATIRKYKQDRFYFCSQPYNSNVKTLKTVSSKQTCFLYDSLLQAGSVCHLKALQPNRKCLNQIFQEQQILIPTFFYCIISSSTMKFKVYFSHSVLFTEFFSSRGEGGPV